MLPRGRIIETWSVPLTAAADIAELPADTQLLKIHGLPDKGGVAFKQADEARVSVLS